MSSPCTKIVHDIKAGESVSEKVIKCECTVTPVKKEEDGEEKKAEDGEEKKPEDGEGETPPIPPDGGEEKPAEEKKAEAEEA